MPGSSPVVDVHHHFLPPQVLEELRQQAGGAPRLVNDRISITLTAALADPAVHLRAMDEGGVDVAILTYSGVSVLGLDVCRQLNDGFAVLQREHAGRFYGSVHVCLSEPDLAPAELRRGARDLGLRAVALATSEPGVTLDKPQLDPIWRTIEELDLPVILHPALLPEGASTDYSLERSCYRPF
ncbi:MAG: amidohydrolase family protein, partial [Chloroflexi bacterium]|nr:amidohydrolase family protein [Chloroflexota bacterium]